jgi:hypothetical protein
MPVLPSAKLVSWQLVLPSPDHQGDLRKALNSKGTQIGQLKKDFKLLGRGIKGLEGGGKAEGILALLEKSFPGPGILIYWKKIRHAATKSLESSVSVSLSRSLIFRSLLFQEFYRGRGDQLYALGEDRG